LCYLDKEVGSDSYDEKTPVKGIKAIHAKRITIQEGDVDIVRFILRHTEILAILLSYWKY
jgi:hypothetical protein